MISSGSLAIRFLDEAHSRGHRLVRGISKRKARPSFRRVRGLVFQKEVVSRAIDELTTETLLTTDHDTKRGVEKRNKSAIAKNLQI